MLDVKRLKAEMVLSGVTQQELAHKIGISEQTMTRRMKCGNFTINEAAEISKLLNISNPAQIFLGVI